MISQWQLNYLLKWWWLFRKPHWTWNDDHPDLGLISNIYFTALQSILIFNTMQALKPCTFPFLWNVKFPDSFLKTEDEALSVSFLEWPCWFKIHFLPFTTAHLHDWVDEANLWDPPLPQPRARAFVLKFANILIIPLCIKNTSHQFFNESILGSGQHTNHLYRLRNDMYLNLKGLFGKNELMSLEIFYPLICWVSGQHILLHRCFSFLFSGRK